MRTENTRNLIIMRMGTCRKADDFYFGWAGPAPKKDCVSDLLAKCGIAPYSPRVKQLACTLPFAHERIYSPSYGDGAGSTQPLSSASF